MPPPTLNSEEPESCPVNAIVEAVALFLLTYVASFHHALRLSATPDSTLP